MHNVPHTLAPTHEFDDFYSADLVFYAQTVFGNINQNLLLNINRNAPLAGKTTATNYQATPELLAKNTK